MGKTWMTALVLATEALTAGVVLSTSLWTVCGGDHNRSCTWLNSEIQLFCGLVSNSYNIA